MWQPVQGTVAADIGYAELRLLSLCLHNLTFLQEFTVAAWQSLDLDLEEVPLA